MTGPLYLPVADWPDIDKQSWLHAHDVGDYFTTSGLAAHWSEKTRVRCEREYGRLLLFQIRSGMLRDAQRVGERIAQAEELRPFIEWLRTMIAPKSVVAALAHISQTVRALDPTSDRTLITRARRSLSRAAKPVREIDKNLISPKELWELGWELMQEAEASQEKYIKRRAIRYRDGLLIAFLSLCPIRRKNVNDLRMGEHLKLGSSSNRVHISAEEMKTRKRDFEVTLPKQLIACIERYWSNYRPMLVTSKSDQSSLWLSLQGSAMSADTLHERVTHHLWTRRGVKFSPHMFRHAAATFISDVVPQQALMIMGVLGHTQFRTAREHYIRGQQISAVRTYQSAVENMICGEGDAFLEKYGDVWET